MGASNGQHAEHTVSGEKETSRNVFINKAALGAAPWNAVIVSNKTPLTVELRVGKGGMKAGILPQLKEENQEGLGPTSRKGPRPTPCSAPMSGL